MIQLDKNYRINQDSSNFILRYDNEVKKEGKDKPIKQSDEYYYPNVEMCLNKYVQLRVKQNEQYTDIQELLNELEEIHKTIKNVQI